jgi:DNA-binding NarL/FixJ family response regulator
MSDVTRVAICDDALDFAALLQLLLDGEADMQVVGIAGDGEEGIELCRIEQPDVLLMDVAMPELDGVAALPRILAASPATRVVMLTGFDSRAMESEVRGLGAHSLVLKGTAPHELIAHIRDAHAAGDERREVHDG